MYINVCADFIYNLNYAFLYLLHCLDMIGVSRQVNLVGERR